MRWLRWTQVMALLFLCAAVTKESDQLLEENNTLSKLDIWKKLKERENLEDDEDDNFYEFINKITHGEMFNMSWEAHKILEESGRHWPDTKYEVPEFNCIIDNRPRKKAKTVHELTPYDIDIIAAFGDSLTAAFGAKAWTPVDLFIEYHGVSWSIGGDQTVDKVITLPNILKEYNHNLQGYSTGISPPLIPVASEHLDLAVSGATSYGLMKQAKRFVERLLLVPKYDFFGSWKVLTLFIGGNDLCSCCRRYKNLIDKYSPANFAKEITDVLDYLHAKVPKLFVNLVTPPNVTILQDLASPWCDFTHLLECKCGTVYGEKARRYTAQVLDDYRSFYENLISSKRYDTRDDFTVVLQPFFDKTVIPRLKDNKTIDRSYFAPDCFHFSGKAHQASALALWNSMLEPVGKKSKIWRPHENYHCPTDENPYFYTNLNSNPEVIAKKNYKRKEKQQQQQKHLYFEYSQTDHFFSVLLFLLIVVMTYYVISCRMAKRNAPGNTVDQSPAREMFFDPEIKQIKVPF